MQETVMDPEILQKQREAEQRVRRMREENRRLARQMGELPPEERQPEPLPLPAPAPDRSRLLPLLLAVLLLREGGPAELILALVYLGL